MPGPEDRLPSWSPRQNVTYSVRLGSPRIDQKSPTTSEVPVYQVILNKRYRPHRYWSWVGRAHDIALLKLTWPLKYNKYVWPICLPGLDFEVKDGSLCTVTGWGLPKFDGESEPLRNRWGAWWCVGENPGGEGRGLCGQLFLRHLPFGLWSPSPWGVLAANAS